MEEKLTNFCPEVGELASTVSTMARHRPDDSPPERGDSGSIVVDVFPPATIIGWETACSENILINLKIYLKITYVNSETWLIRKIFLWILIFLFLTLLNELGNLPEFRVKLLNEKSYLYCRNQKLCYILASACCLPLWRRCGGSQLNKWSSETGKIERD